ncbi:MAG: glutathione transferase GstA [Deltaproteobacteria bacterium]|nr:glutathione transferase GstA [Deltaproteobacteria bacterium]
MKLYYAMGTCSLAAHISLREAGLPFTLVRYDMKTELLETGESLTTVNEKGFVPVLELPDGQRLTEVSAVLQYIADQKPESGLAPPNGTLERYRLQEWLNFIATEIHKAYWPLFHKGAEIENQHALERLTRRYHWVEEKLGAREFLLGDRFTVADAYLLTTFNWARLGGLDLAAFPVMTAYRNRLRERPSVLAAMETEGLVKKKPAA